VTLAEYNTFCAALLRTTHVVQWGDAHVWKVGGKVFAIAWDGGTAGVLVTFKVSPLSYDILKEQPGCRPAPYLASRGLTWIQRTGRQSLDDRALRDYLAESHRLVAAGLPKRVQRNLGLAEAAPEIPTTSRPRTKRRARDMQGGQP
jgi:predicted DNA-binding protein (MmcQ/YjbR family)